MQLLARLTLPGNMPRKSNNRDIIMMAGKPASKKSDKALAWVEAAIKAVPVEARHGHPGPLLVIATCYYSSAQSDLSAELFMDALQTKYDMVGSGRKKSRRMHNGKPVVAWPGVYRDDVQIWLLFLRKKLDKKNPRVEVSIFASDPPSASEADHDEWVRQLVGNVGAPLVARDWTQDDISFEDGKS